MRITPPQAQTCCGRAFSAVGRRARRQVHDHPCRVPGSVSRDQEDTAAIFKRLGFAGVKIVTLSEGEISELHVGLKGTMNALYLKDLADKTRRGLRGRIEAGKSGGGNAYGYQVVHALGADGQLVRGDRKIDSEQATVDSSDLQGLCGRAVAARDRAVAQSGRRDRADRQSLGGRRRSTATGSAAPGS